MYVCVCKAVSESAISEAVGRGVRSMRELVQDTGCSSQCGRCAPQVREALSEALAVHQPFLELVSVNRAA
jgi:bacterioferritin-associated ferredoxin